MRTAIAVLLFLVTNSARALEWKSELFHCTANLPDGAGWQAVEAPPLAGLTTLVVMQHTGRQAVFGINIVDKVPGSSVSEPAVRQTLERMLRQFGYQFIGLSTVKVGGLDWLQYPVRSGSGAQQVSGLIRFASAGGYIFGITMLRGGGQEAASDVEMQQAAASFRVQPTIAAAAPPAEPQMMKQMAAAPPPSAAEITSMDGKVPGPATEEPAADTDSKLRIAWYVGGGMIVLLVLFQIIGGGKTERS